MKKRATGIVGLTVGLIAALIGLAVAPASASHSWGSYHWKQLPAGVTLRYNSNLTTPDWQTRLDGNTVPAPELSVINDWDQSLQLVLAKGQSNVQDPRQCKARSGTIQVCNASYGRNGWLGIAQIWTSGGHIVQAVTKVNDTYFNTATYNTPAWRQMVLCQEVGHDFGLTHQDENFSNANLNTCMDYTSSPLGNQQPNAHDYEQLGCIYDGHDYGTPSTHATGCSGPLSGTKTGNSTYVEELGNGRRVVTHVFWVDPRVAHGPPF